MTNQPELSSESSSGSPPESFSVNELSLLAELPLRTVRYYITQGLVDRPHGEKRGAWYDRHHLDQLLQIRKWSAAGLSLERIRELLHGGPVVIPERPKQIGAIQVRSHVWLGPGLELQVSAEDAGLSPEQLRQLVTAVTQALATIQGKQS
ncbi:helix-turn-helix domain-containing protein [Malikia spinosa]|uniref:helix-turn-helix domain-containing protein n=1 Tax=Malikia spinosa TaxID=86180 RepID=UPI003FA249BF